jgi:O-antigen ligase
MIVLVVVFGPLDVSSGAPKMTVGLDSKVAIKLLISGIASLLGAYGLVTSAAVRQTMSTLPALGISIILLLAGLATPIAISNTSLPTTLINFGTLLFVVTALLTLKLHRVGLGILVGVAITAFISLSLWYLLPAYGVFPELLAGGLIVERLSGTAHPNAVGRAMVLGLVLSLYYYRMQTLPILPAVCLAAMFALAAYLTLSRTSMVAGFAGLLVLYLDRIFTRTGVLVVSFMVVVGVGSLTLLYLAGTEDKLVGNVLSKVSKTGDAEEITSGTGRSEIWTKAISLIKNRPIIGHGFSAAPTLMIDHSQATHNSVLHATLTAGIVGGVMMLGLMLWCVYLATASDSLLIRCTAALVVIASLAEDAVLETFPGPITTMFLVCCIYPVIVRPKDQNKDVDDAPPNSLLARDTA